MFIKRLAEGKGVTQESYDQYLKGIASSDIFEYRDKSTLLKKQIRIYFGAHGRLRPSYLFVQVSKEVRQSRIEI